MAWRLIVVVLCLQSQRGGCACARWSSLLWVAGFPLAWRIEACTERIFSASFPTLEPFRSCSSLLSARKNFTRPRGRRRTPRDRPDTGQGTQLSGTRHSRRNTLPTACFFWADFGEHSFRRCTPVCHGLEKVDQFCSQETTEGTRWCSGEARTK